MAATASPDRILRELADLWVSLGKGEGAGVLRACSMTLVTVTGESDDPAELGETLAALMPEHPARTIVLRLHPGGSRRFEARVLAQCWMPFGQRRQICCEQVEITASEEQLDEAGSVILPLCVPDLPVIVWGRSPGVLEMPGFAELAAMARKVIVDTSAAPDPKVALERLKAIATRILLGDLAWTRLTRWREVLARVFENTEYKSRLHEISHIRIGFGGNAPSTPALYMAAWISDSLRDAGVRASVAFESSPDARPAELATVRLHGAAAGLDVSLAAKGDVLTAHAAGISHCATVPRSNEYLLMREELGIVREDPVFRKTLSSAMGLAVSSGVK